jgi:hypothetical protein
MHPKPWYARIHTADLGVGMTVCLAGLCGSQDWIAIAIDRKLSFGWTSADDAVWKFTGLNNNWFALYSSDDLTHIDPIFRAGAIKFIDYPAPITADVAAQLFCAAYQERRKKQAEDQHLSVYGLTMERFLAEGQKLFSRADLKELNRRINEIDLDSEFLLAGFDDIGKGHIFTVSNPGVSKHYDQVGYWAIGGGHHASLAALQALHYLPYNSIERNLYKICAAKFAGETASGVGEKTVAIAFQHGQNPIGIYTEASVKEIKKAWENHGRPKIPDGIEARIGQMLKPLEEKK